MDAAHSVLHSKTLSYGPEQAARGAVRKHRSMKVAVPPIILNKCVEGCRVGAVGNRVDDEGVSTFCSNHLIHSQNHPRIVRDDSRRLFGDVVEAANVCCTIDDHCGSVTSQKFTYCGRVPKIRPLRSACGSARKLCTSQRIDRGSPYKAGAAQDQDLFIHGGTLKSRLLLPTFSAILGHLLAQSAASVAMPEFRRKDQTHGNQPP